MGMGSTYKAFVELSATGSGRLSRIHLGLIPNAFSKSRRQKRHRNVFLEQEYMHLPEKNIHVFDVVWWCYVMFNSFSPSKLPFKGYLGPIFRFPILWCELTGVIKVFLTGSPVQTDIEDGQRLLACRRIFPCHNWAFGYSTWRTGKSPLFIGKSW